MNNGDSPLLRQVLSGKPVVCFTNGDSMEPLLRHRASRVVVRRTDRPLKPGDLPLYRRPDGTFILHRIISADDRYYYTRGDNRCGLEQVPREWVLGVVTEIYRKGRHFSVTHPLYRSYVALWNGLYPLRWAAYKCRGRMKKK